jgi:hypothetical protein
MEALKASLAGKTPPPPPATAAQAEAAAGGKKKKGAKAEPERPALKAVSGGRGRR